MLNLQFDHKVYTCTIWPEMLVVAVAQRPVKVLSHLATSYMRGRPCSFRAIPVDKLTCPAWTDVLPT